MTHQHWPYIQIERMQTRCKHTCYTQVKSYTRITRTSNREEKSCEKMKILSFITCRAIKRAYKKLGDVILDMKHL